MTIRGSNGPDAGSGRMASLTATDRHLTQKGSVVTTMLLAYGTPSGGAQS